MSHGDRARRRTSPSTGARIRFSCGTLLVLFFFAVTAAARSDRGCEPIVDLKTQAEAIALSPDGQVLALGGERGQVVLVSLDASTPSRTLKAASDEPTRRIEFSADGKRILVCTRDRAALIQTATGETLSAVDLHGAWFIEASPDLRAVVAARFETTSNPALGVLGAVLTGSEHGAAAGVGQRCEITNYDLTSGKAKRLFKTSSMIFRIAVSGDGRYLAVLTVPRHGIVVVDRESGKTVSKLSPLPMRYQGIAFGPEHATIAYFDQRGREVVIADALTGAERLRLAAPGMIIDALEFSRDGSRLAAVGREGVIVWSLSDKRTLLRAPEPMNTFKVDFSFSEDGLTFAVESRGRVRVFALPRTAPDPPQPKKPSS